MREWSKQDKRLWFWIITLVLAPFGVLGWAGPEAAVNALRALPLPGPIPGILAGLVAILMVLALVWFVFVVLPALFTGPIAMLVTAILRHRGKGPLAVDALLAAVAAGILGGVFTRQDLRAMIPLGLVILAAILTVALIHAILALWIRVLVRTGTIRAFSRWSEASREKAERASTVSRVLRGVVKFWVNLLVGLWLPFDVDAVAATADVVADFPRDEDKARGYWVYTLLGLCAGGWALDGSLYLFVHVLGKQPFNFVSPGLWPAETGLYRFLDILAVGMAIGYGSYITGLVVITFLGLFAVLRGYRAH